MQQTILQPKQMGTVRFDSDPHGANIYVDGQILTDPDIEQSLKTPARVLLYEGRRDYTISLEGYEDASGYVDIFPGATVNVYKRLKKGVSEEGWGQPEPQIWLSQQTPKFEADQIKKYIQYYFMSDTIKSLQGPAMGTVVITTYPTGAAVEMDGRMVIDVDTKDVLKTPVQMEVGIGQHNFVFKLEGYCNESETVYILPGTGVIYINKTFYVC